MPRVPLWRYALAGLVGVASTASAQNRPGSAYHVPTTTRPTPAWYDDAKLGIFIHWGAYSVPAWAPPLTPADVATFDWSHAMENNPYAEWYLNTMKFPDSPTGRHHAATWGRNFDYTNFFRTFDQESRRWNPDQWARLFRRTGARYVVLTTKHHDGFLLWPSRQVNPNRPADLQHTTRDIVGELTAAVRRNGMRMGLYYSGGLDWSFNPARIDDVPSMRKTIPNTEAYGRYADQHWRELIERYQPSILWNDIGYPSTGQPAAIVRDFYARTPDGVVNNRWGNDLGDYLTPEFQNVPDVPPHKWESCRGIGFSFGYNAAEQAENMLTSAQLIEMFVDIVARNGNLLLDLGPRPDGSIPELQLERLNALGDWLQVNGDGIFGTRPWRQPTGTTVDGLPIRYTRKGRTLFAFLMSPAGASVVLPDLRGLEFSRVRQLGSRRPLRFAKTETGLSVTLTPAASGYPLGLAIETTGEP
ncbi:MAG: alpha-L-fucosidase [Gemmatimonadetes bacterium]|nr:alpha-L-fucosidase [Gemmatimonadota bacterium]